MQALMTLLVEHGVLIVFAVTMAARAGVPVPAAPLLVAAGGVAMHSPQPAAVAWTLALLVAIAANVAGDGVWFYAGRRHGHRIMGLLCRLSLSPDSCVRQSEDLMTRWGGGALVAAKFVPGVSVVAAPMAGALGMSVPRFVAYDVLAGAIWSALFLGLGAVFSREVEAVIAALADAGLAAGALLLAVVAAFAGWRWLRRQRFLRSLAMQRISVDELKSLVDSAQASPGAGAERAAPMIIDVRSNGVAQIDGRRIPGASAVALAEIERHAARLPRDRDIVLYCNCPNEASAALAAQRLARQGFSRVRPLAGGLDAWAAAGHPVATD
ncbi:major capsid protein [Aquincola sp. MAHUQ-54]|uniref:Major capsid protein n=1 Tax=Aquincola agrisoli TaxID=3119538 RepID=A0AAW9Q569_9BURK